MRYKIYIKLILHIFWSAYFIVNTVNGQSQSNLEKPNILFIYTDDQAAWTLGTYGNKQAYTPNIDRLAFEGVTMENAFSVTPVCSPARASLLTSRYGSEIGITDFIVMPGHRLEKVADIGLGLEQGISTFPKLLSDGGYKTALIGKWHIGSKEQHHPTMHGYDEFMGFLHGGAEVENPVFEVNGINVQFEGLTVDVLTDLAIEFLNKQKANNQTFFLSLHYRSPHGPWRPVADEDDLPYLDVELEIAHPDFPNLHISKVRNNMRNYLASVSGVDRNVGRLLSKLNELGLKENTIVIFSSDDGYNIGHNGLASGKGNAIWALEPLPPILPDIEQRYRPNLYDNSLKVPLIIRWPGVTISGSRVTETVTELDWYPTILSMANIEVPDSVKIHGRDFTPLLRGEKIEWNNDLYAEYSMINYAFADMKAYRTPEWKLIIDNNNRARDELYDLINDPEETHNIINDPSSRIRSIKNMLTEKLKSKLKYIEKIQ